MKLNVKPGQIILFRTVTCQYAAVVLTVTPKTLTIADPHRENGVTAIICNQKGKYFYSGNSPISHLTDEQGNPIKVSTFIED